jgi:acyl carrier protein
MPSLEARIRAVLAPIALKPLPEDASASLFAGGAIDSFGLMDAVARLEEELGVEVPDADLHPRRFESIAKIERYFSEKAPVGG